MPRFLLNLMKHSHLYYVIVILLVLFVSTIKKLKLSQTDSLFVCTVAVCNRCTVYPIQQYIKELFY